VYKNVPQHLLSSAKLCKKAERKLDLEDRICLLIFGSRITDSKGGFEIIEKNKTKKITL
jgi:hypothetical protein